MRRVIASMSILLTLIVLCVTSLAALGSECRWYAGLTQNTINAVSRGDTETALERYDRMLAHWEEFHDLTGMFVDGEKLDAIYEHMIGLRPLIEQEHPEVLSELSAIRLLVDGLYEEELPNLWHIL